MELIKLAKKNYGIVIAIITVIIIELLFNTNIIKNTFGTNFFPSLERSSLDVMMRIRGERENTGSVVVIKVDEHTESYLPFPFPHNNYGVAMAALSYSGAKAIGLDIFVTKKHSDTTSSDLFVNYLSYAQNTYQIIGPFISTKSDEVTITDATASNIIGKFGINAPSKHHFPRSPYIESYPFPELANASTGIGHVLLNQLDGYIRSFPLFVEYNGKLYPSLSFALALNVLKINPDQIKFEDTDEGTIVYAGSLVIPTGLDGEVLINYISKSEDIKSYSFVDIIHAAADTNEITRDKFFIQFKNKVCLIGPTLRSVGDYYSTPLDKSTAGVYTHANIYDMIMMNAFISNPSPLLQIAFLIIITCLIGYYTHKKHIKIGILTIIICVVIFLLFAYAAFYLSHTWFNIAAPLTSFILCFISTVAYKAATEGRQKRIITNMFGTYLDNNIVKILINNPELAKLGGRKHEVSILFTDIKGFSSISEQVTEDILVKLMNVYFTEMTNVIIANGGSVDKFIGDSIMAFWGAPVPDSDSAYHACVAALQMQAQLEKAQSKLVKLGGIEIKHRIGINTGLCIVGNMGSEQKKNYTVTGDPVNLASRLEGVNKQYGTEILISQFTYNKVAKRVHVRQVDKVQVVGKTEPVIIYELIGTADKNLSDNQKYFLDFYAQGIKAYQERKWEEGIAIMEHAMQKNPNDTVCQLYIERMKLYQIHPPADSWNGVFVLHSK